MATTYMRLTQQIKALQAQAERVKKKEIGDVIARIKEAIAVYSLTAEELGFGGASSAKSKARVKSAGVKSGPGKQPKTNRPAVAYRDRAGNTWGGRGPRPAWLRAALQGGADLVSFAVGSTPPAGVAGAAEIEAVAMPAVPTKKARSAASRKATKAPKAPAVVKYKDDTGHTWSGFGPKPGWFKDALAAGKTLEELAAG